MKINGLGFDQWYESQSAELHQEDCCFARVCAVDRGSYRILNESGEVPAELTGKLLYQADSPIDLPCVGDWVTAYYYNDDSAAMIHKVFPRKTFLRRKSAGENVDFQMIAANIDIAFIVQSCHFDFNPNRLDRYLVMAAEGHIEPIILLTKTDLIPHDELDQKLSIIRSASKARVYALSSLTNTGFDEFRQLLSPGKTYCLLGSSGVGKTTLINKIIGRETFQTQSVSGTGEGTHTTTRRQLVVLDHGAMLIDTPGMRELGVVGAYDGVDAGFGEIAELARNCRYANCGHKDEPGCAIRAAIESDKLSEDRYLSYTKLKKESEFYGMTYQEKRKKDKAFGKFIKSVKKKIKG